MTKHAFSAARIATTILNGFEASIEDHNRVTMGARERFENGDWEQVQQAQKLRADAYRAGIRRAAEKLEKLAGDVIQDHDIWAQVKLEYDWMTRDHDNRNILQTFYNSVYAHWFSFKGFDEQFVFADGDPHTDREIDPRVFNRFPIREELSELAINILDRYEFNLPWVDADTDADNIGKAFKQALSDNGLTLTDLSEVQVLKSIFYRNRGAYIVARILCDTRIIPLILPISRTADKRVYVDAALTHEDDVSIIFSFTRAHFMVDARIPQSYVDFLHSMVPGKHRYELYTTLGFIKHGKTEFVRDFQRHAATCDDKIILAPGIRGMVMAVFTLPSFDVVFKVIRDQFAPPKKVTRDLVKQKYRLVNRHDRAGRMADTQEFNNFWLDKSLFDPDCLASLLEDASQVIEVVGDQVRIAHVYIERRMTPLNIYIEQASEEELTHAMKEYGYAIKEIATANIFPGDMLLKNFGVTRHGRVIFYDYDEICFLRDCEFRKIPPPRNDREAMASTPWYHVGENDVFPEEFRLFFAGNLRAKRAFEAYHQDLYEAQTWKNIQDSIGTLDHGGIYPYNRSLRFYPERAN